MTESDEALEEVARSIGMLVITIAFLAGFAVGWYLRSEIMQESSYREKANFCVDRMKSDDVLSAWRQMYCSKSGGRK